jgi:hypothetical protein
MRDQLDQTDYQDEGVNRRSFIRNISLAVLAAGAAGTGAAILAGNQKPGEVVFTSGPPSAPPLVNNLPPVQSIPAVQSAQTAVQAHEDAGQALARLAEAQAENVRLQAALDAAQRELDSLRAANSDTSSMSEELSKQLAGATEQIGVLSGLVALYEQLDAADVTDSIQAGLDTVSGTIAGLIDGTPSLSQGIAAGQQALADVDAHLPVLEDGRNWLDAQANKLGAFYQTIELTLQNVLESFGSFLDMVEDWFEGIRKWLPFGIGENAARVVSAFSDLVAETPHTVGGVNDHILQPLDAWLTRVDNEPVLRQTLIRPLRDQVLVEAENTIGRAHQVHSAYHAEVAQPIAMAKLNRDEIRRRINDYKQQYLV